MKSIKFLITVAAIVFLSGPFFQADAQTIQVEKATQDEKAEREEKAGDDQQKEISLSERMLHFMRVRRNADKRPMALETSVTRYEKELANGETLVVDLIGVVHIGEKEYYEELNEIFSKYDALLYELVAPEGTRIPKGGRGASDGMNPLAAVQNGMKSMLELDFQLDHIDYTKNNFVHADMTPEEFLESMEKNDESFLKMAFKAIGQSMAMQNKSQMSDADLMMAMLSSDRTTSLRRLMAEQMQDMDSGMVIFNGKDGSTIINHRNRKAFTILDREIEDGKRKIGVFYGAGHLPDMEDLLMDEREMKRAGQFWLEAWNLRKKRK